MTVSLLGGRMESSADLGGKCTVDIGSLQGSGTHWLLFYKASVRLKEKLDRYRRGVSTPTLIVRADSLHCHWKGFRFNNWVIFDW